MTIMVVLLIMILVAFIYSKSSSKTQITFTPQLRHLSKYEIEPVKQLLKIASESTDLVNTTVKPNVFFGRYDLLASTLRKLIPYENGNVLTGTKPSASLADMQVKKDIVIREFINRAFNRALSESSALKTETGRVNRLLKFFAEMEDYKHNLGINGMDYLNELKSKNTSNILVSAPTVSSKTHINYNATVNTEKQSKIVSIFSKKWRAVAEKEFIVIDIETTGLNKNADKIIEVAAIRYKNGEEVDKFVSFINPKTKIPPEAMAVNKITDNMLRNAPSAEQVFPDFMSFLGKSLLVAHNANFDVGFIEIQARKLGYTPFWNYVDTISVAKKAIPGLANYKQQTILDAIGYKQDTYHRAEDDCRGCAEIMLLAMNSLAE